MIRVPFVRASYKWKAIRKSGLHFEINRSLYLKGLPCEPSILNEISFGPEGAGPEMQGRTTAGGDFVLDVAFNGLSIRGAAASPSAGAIKIALDGKVLRIVTLGPDRSFSLKVGRGVLGLFPSEGRLTIIDDSGEALSYRGSASAIVRVPSGDGSLFGALERGCLMTKRGGLSATLEDASRRQDDLLSLYEDARDAFDRAIRRPLFLMYGTLLGYVRGKDFIPNDDDFDAGYVSGVSRPEEVKAEALGIIRALLREGFSVRINSVGRLFKLSRGTGVHLDIMPVWFEGEWNVAYRGAGVRACLGDFLPVGEGCMRGQKVLAPARPEVFLEGYYGEGWRVPDPGYVSDIDQTGKNLRKNYSRFLITPSEFLHLEREVEEERSRSPGIGRLEAACLRGEV